MTQPKVEWPIRINYPEVSERLQTCLTNRYFGSARYLAERLKISEELASRVVYRPKECSTLHLLSVVAEMCRQKRFSADWIFLGIDDVAEKGDCGICLENGTAPRFDSDEAYSRLAGMVAKSKELGEELSRSKIRPHEIGRELNSAIQGDYPSLDFIASVSRLSKVSLDFILLGTNPAE